MFKKIASGLLFAMLWGTGSVAVKQISYGFTFLIKILLLLVTGFILHQFLVMSLVTFCWEKRLLSMQ